MTTEAYDGVKVFSATKAGDRALLGEKITAWLQANPGNRVVKVSVTQSSDSSFHCLSVVLFFTAKLAHA